MTYSLIKPILTSDYALFARASTGTYFNTSKVLQVAAVEVPRINWNPLTGAFEGVLIEPARTNQLIQTNGASYRLTLQQTVRFGPGYLTAGVPYTLSFYGTGTVTLSGVVATTVVGTGAWARTTLTITPGAGTLTFTPAGDVLYAQFEQGAYPTSFIPTTSASVTRAADVITGTGIFMTTFPEPVAEYNPATTYATGQTVRVATRLYESLVDGNVGNNPPDTSTKGDPAAKWLDVGASNRFACLDQTVSTGSVGPGPIQIMALKLPQDAQAIALPGSSGTKVHAAISNGAGTVISKSSTAIDPEFSGQTPWFGGYAGGTIVSVAIETTAAEAVLGELIVGTYHEIGGTQYGHKFGLTSYSLKETDPDFGRTRFVRRPSAKRMGGVVEVDKANYNAVVRLMQAIDGVPTVHIATDDPAYSAGAVVFGWVDDFEMEIPYPTKNLCSVTIQGLI